MAAIPASFWRGGTSRGLILRAKDLVKYNSIQRDKIILNALGSPDPSGRQIDGLGGGVSSLSKCCLIGAVGEGRDGQYFNELGGVSWADEGSKDGKSWDIVYRFAQVPIRDSKLDWASTCGNMLSAVALSSITSSIVPYSTLFSRARSLPPPAVGEPLLLPISILSAATGDVFLARIPLHPTTLEAWEPEVGKGCVIAGVPGEAAGIVLELPLAEGGGLMTGNAQDIVSFEDIKIPVSILSVGGLPNIFVSISSLDLPSSLLALPLSSLTSHPILPPLLERVRVFTANKFSLPLSLSSPKITLVAPMPEEGYQTSADVIIAYEEADLLVRAVSSGDFHATIPGTTLSALNLGLGIQGTIIEQIVKGKKGKIAAGKDVVTVRAGHAAGVTESTLRFEDGKPKSVVMFRTAREIFRGEILIPQKVLN